MQELSYGAFSARRHREAIHKRIPISGSFELTYRCPLTCSHCYNNLPMGDRDAQASELTTEQAKRILTEAAELGCLYMLFTGGEIFARKDFLEIYAHAKRQGLIITLFTNATMVTPVIADALQAMPPFAIEITLYGATRETYERLTGLSGSYDRCLRGIELLKERGLPVRLKTAVTTVNRHEVGMMQAFGRSQGFAFKFDSLMNPRIDCSQSPLEVRLRPEHVVELDLEDPQRVEELKNFTAQYMLRTKTKVEAETLYHCGGGATAFSVSPTGMLSICLLSQCDQYDLRKGTFRDGWQGFLKDVRQKPVTRPTKCTRCDLKATCGMCPANGELESGDPEAPVAWLCEVAHLRALTFGLEVPEHGECEFCQGGEFHAQTLEKTHALQAGHALFRTNRRLPLAPQRQLASFSSAGSGCGTGSCGSCG